MKLYLVVWVGLQDEIPLRIFGDLLDARDFAADVPWETPAEYSDVMGRGFGAPTKPHSIAIATFENGQFSEWDQYRSYEEEIENAEQATA